MERLFRFVIVILLLCNVWAVAFAQDPVDQPIQYYNSHPTEILTDAQFAFRNSRYERAAELCHWHYIIVGDTRADGLKDKANRCAQLYTDMTALKSAGKMADAREKAREILKINPDDRMAKELTTPGSLKVSSTPAGAMIWLNGKRMNLTTPEILEDLVAGQYTLRLTLEGYEDYEGSVTVSSGRRENVQLTLTRSNIENGHEYVDLGLSVKWATCNVGASSPSDYGSYFAWGEIKPKSEYTWSTLKYCTDTSGDHFSKYVPYDKSSYWSGTGSPDNKKRLDMTDDAARQNWGGSWRMPTDAEWTELREKCEWTWTTQDDISGYRVTSRTNGNSIFLPAAGGRGGGSLNGAGSDGKYWSSSLNTGSPYGAWLVFFDSTDVLRCYNRRFSGRSVRPVTE